MWTDLETRVDFVNYSRLAGTIAALIREPHMTPLTIGIHGDWGSGKSSVTKMVYDALPKDDFLRVSFNGWAFEGFEDAKLALMETLVDELARNQKILDRARDTVVSLIKRLNYLKLLRKGASLALNAHGLPFDIDLVLERLKKRDNGHEASTEGANGDDGWLRAATSDAPNHIHGFRTELETLVEKAKAGRLVVFIDDLDRCLPETALATLEAIKLFMSVKDTTFVIAADEAFIQYAVSQHFPGIPASSGPGTVSSNYLEKLIQIPFRLPRLNRAESRRYVSLLLMEHSLRPTPAVFDSILGRIEHAAVMPWESPDLRTLIADAEFRPYQTKLTQQLDLAAQISAPLDDIAKGNPRQIKRFLNTLTLRRRIAEAYGVATSIDDRVLAKLQLLERFSPDSYGAIIGVATTRPDGKVPFLAELEARDLEADGVVALSDGAVPSGFTGDEAQRTWILAWLKAGTHIGEIDLRPYIFVSRESATDFTTGADIEAALAALAMQLMEADPFAAAALAPRVDALNAEERRKVTQTIVDAAMTSGRIDQRPNELRNLHLITGTVPDAQSIVLARFEALPIGSIRPWMPAFLLRLIKAANHQEAVRRLFDEWRKTTDPQVTAAMAFITGRRA